MENFVLGRGRKLFAQHLKDYEPQDPLYETYTDSRGRQKRRKRDLPPGLTPRDAQILKSVNRRAHYLDKGFRILGMRFGWTFVVGIIPGAGDVADVCLNYFLVVRKAKQAGIPDHIYHRMLANNLISATVGFIPLVGDVFLAIYKANSRNAALLEAFLRERAEQLQKEIEEAQRAAAQMSVVPGGPAEQRPTQKKESSRWFSRRGKSANIASAAKPPAHRPSGSGDSRFVEAVSS
ncbi:uncharacterized protein C8Q71DRAFT_751365 [Rhodofomes roseus]|uniref:DUF4112 domain-containing protein n=1 Tax=Rhodofomes roseus TaxID=34475 RepID=A0A4Y9YU30_9APHY|nr:uncharacterized protein C8Q71DRAFT_751365 [Rhodofomes roseus]KAH9838456.1 hypothetical protein C8Q71DRAFT_751365 [Rhodofomes roseus]TFY65198.1 hypothetical protein EVJ58_g2121 [Rhodofomes roseus]